MILYLDTATSDLWLFPRKGIPVEDDREPHMVRLSWLLEPGDGRTEREACHLIRLPTGLSMGHLSIPAERHRVASVTGIYDHALNERGMDMFDVLTEFAEALGQASLVVAHNWHFHKQVLDRSFRYVGMPAREWHDADKDPGGAGVATSCAMFKATNIVQIPKQALGGGFRWPRFDECCERFCGGALHMGADPVAHGIERVRAVRVFWQNIVRAANA